METTPRFEQAIKKLYNAFHNDTLHPEFCQSCAVGNICDNLGSWQHLTDSHGSLKLNYVGLVNQNLGRTIFGYTPLELLKIEQTFLEACGYHLPLKTGSKRPKNAKDKNLLFKGLCAVIEYLCELDHLENVMDYSKLFEHENNIPRYPFALLKLQA